MNTYFYLTLLLINFGVAQSLQTFITSASENNLQLLSQVESISQKKIEDAKSLSHLLPSVDLNARYSRAGGGRSIDFPVGDLLNPVYGGLFQLTANPAYNIQINNEAIPLLREKEHDTKLSITQVFDYRLFLALDISAEQLKIAKHQDRILHDKIIMEVIQTYLTLAKLERIHESLNQNFELIQESKRTTQALFKNNMVTKSALLEVDVQIATIQKELLVVQRNSKRAKQYLNHLCQRDLNTPVEIEPILVPMAIMNQNDIVETAIQKRSELNLLHSQTELYQTNKSIKSAAYLPQFIIKADIGYQGERYKFDNTQDYWMVSGVLNFNLFNGFSDQYDIEIAELNIQKSEYQEKEIKEKIQIEVEDAIIGYQVQKEQLTLSETQVSLASENYRIVQKKYAQGLANQLELTNAFTLIKTAQINYESDKIELLKAKYNIDYVSGTLTEQFK